MKNEVSDTNVKVIFDQIILTLSVFLRKYIAERS